MPLQQEVNEENGKGDEDEPGKKLAVVGAVLRGDGKIGQAERQCPDLGAGRAQYVIRQQPEPVLEIPLDLKADAAAAIGWAVGNLHFPIEAQPTRLLAPDDSGLRQALDRLGIHYHAITEVFQPHRFAGSLAGHGHHPHHDHAHGHGHHH